MNSTIDTQLSQKSVMAGLRFASAVMGWISEATEAIHNCKREQYAKDCVDDACLKCAAAYSEMVYGSSENKCGATPLPLTLTPDERVSLEVLVETAEHQSDMPSMDERSLAAAAVRSLLLRLDMAYRMRDERN